MDISNTHARIFQLRRQLAGLRSDYRQATEKDLQFSIKKEIRLQIKIFENELSSLEKEIALNTIAGKDYTN